MLKIITSKDNTKIKYVSRLLSSSHFRKREKRFVAEGIRLCTDAILSEVYIETAFLTREIRIKEAELYKKIDNKVNEIFEVSEELFKRISETKNPQGIAFICRQPEYKKVKYNKNMIALENVQNPLNMGTVFRTAEAFGIDTIAVSEESCDVYSPKVVRGSMGAVFRLNIFVLSNMMSFLKECRSNGMILCSSLPDNNVKNILDINFKKGYYLMAVGNEANGLSDKVISLCDEKVTIPMRGNAESLNAAVGASILMWEMMKGFM